MVLRRETTSDVVFCKFIFHTPHGLSRWLLLLGVPVHFCWRASLHKSSVFIVRYAVSQNSDENNIWWQGWVYEENLYCDHSPKPMTITAADLESDGLLGNRSAGNRSWENAQAWRTEASSGGRGKIWGEKTSPKKLISLPGSLVSWSPPNPCSPPAIPSLHSGEIFSAASAEIYHILSDGGMRVVDSIRDWGGGEKGRPSGLEVRRFGMNADWLSICDERQPHPV